MSSACFEHYVFIIRKTICTWSFFMLCFSCIYVSSLAGRRARYIHLLDCLHKRMKNTIKTACTNGLPDDEHMILETRRIHEELN